MRRLGMRAVIVAVCALMLSAPVLAAENWPDSFDQYMAQARKTVKTIDMDGFLAVVKNPDGALILDVREDDEFKAGHVPGAVNIPRGLLEFRIWKLLGHPQAVDTSRRMYLYCATGGRCTLAARQLAEIGFTNVVAVPMNLRDWQKNGHPLVR